MEPIDEQWNPGPSIDITSKSWINITDAKKAIKIWILDPDESWAPSNQSNKTRLQLHCLLSSCAFYIGVRKNTDDSFRVTSYAPIIALLQHMLNLNLGAQRSILRAV